MTLRSQKVDEHENDLATRGDGERRAAGATGSTAPGAGAFVHRCRQCGAWNGYRYGGTFGTVYERGSGWHCNECECERWENDANAEAIVQGVKKNSHADLAAAIKAISWQVTLLDVWLAEQSLNRKLTSDQEAWVRERVTLMHAAEMRAALVTAGVK